MEPAGAPERALCAAFAADTHAHKELRAAAIDTLYRAPETECLPPLIEAASLAADRVERARGPRA